MEICKYSHDNRMNRNVSGIVYFLGSGIEPIIIWLIICPDSFILISGTKHFLLMCNVRAEDSGEIKFVARQVESVAYVEVEGIINSLNKIY